MQGWMCPGCSRCFSPFVAQCPHCGQTGVATSGLGFYVQPPPCVHEFDMNCTAPSCRRCGQLWQPPLPSVIWCGST